MEGFVRGLSQPFESIIGVLDIETKNSSDTRGLFAKFFEYQNLENDSRFHLEESFVTFSKKDVLRGMHLQIGESASTRLIYLIAGEIDDVLIDLRRDFGTYGNIQKRSLIGMESPAILVPQGVAHGFKAISDCFLLYLSDKPWNQQNDTGINPFSFSYSWNISNPIISSRDLALPQFEDFEFH